jgi:hypothetical protein
MSTEKTTKRRDVEQSYIPQMVSMSPAPCRMIAVEVFREPEGAHFVRWNDVVGVLCVVETEYLKARNGNGRFSRPGANHEEMTDLGWQSNHPPNWFPSVWPVVAGGNANDEYGLRVLHDRLSEGAMHSTVLVCHWPREEDEQNAIRAAKQMMDGFASGTWMGLASTTALLTEEEPAKS